MLKNFTPAAALLLAVSAASSSALADLVVTTDLGALVPGQYNLSGTTVGKPNNAAIYSIVANNTTVAWDRGEYVYQFTINQPSFFFLTDWREPDPSIPATETTPFIPAPNHDYFLLNSLTTFPTDNTAAYYNGTGKPEGTSLAWVQESMNGTTSGSSANIGMYRSNGPTATNPNNPTNPFGIFQPGTYYISVDARGTTSNLQPNGNFFANFNVAPVGGPAPTNTRTVISPGSTISGNYAAGDVKFFSFDYTGGAFTVDTQNNSVGAANGDTFLALYREDGGLVTFNDDVLPPAWSKISITDGQIPAGRYYLGFTEYKGEANPGFNLRVHPEHVGASGTWVINGLALDLLAGDADGDGDVDLDDQGIWASNFTGSLDPGTGTGTFGQGDFDGDKDVDLDDQGIWASNFTGSLAPSALAAVPEPTALAACGLALPLLAARRRRAGK